MARPVPIVAAAAGVAVLNYPNPMDTILQWIGFGGAAQRNLILGESIADYADLSSMSVKEVSDMARDYGRRSGAQRIAFGTRRTRYLKSTVNWAQDCYRCSTMPDIEDLVQADFLAVLNTAAERDQIRTAYADQSDKISKEASPGKLVDERKWPEWESAFVNYLSTIPGSDGVPLSYVVREIAAPTPTGHADFTEKCIACAPQTGSHWDADKRSVHQLIQSFVKGESAEDWVKPIKRQANGRADLQALRDHFSGEGNSSRRIGEAERLRDTLHYKSERAMTFETFLTKTKKMMNIFEEEQEAWTADAQIRWFFQKVQHPQLQANVAALEATRLLNPAMTLTTIANSLAANVSNLPEVVSMRARGISVIGTGQDKGRSGIHAADGSIYTGYYKTWGALTKEERGQVIAERSRLGIKSKTPGTGGGPKRRAAATKSKKQVTKLKKDLKNAKRTIAVMRKKDSPDEEDDDDSDVPDDAGNQFGGRESKRNKKTRFAQG
jgi:hypothetical protein